MAAALRGNITAAGAAAMEVMRGMAVIGKPRPLCLDYVEGTICCGCFLSSLRTSLPLPPWLFLSLFTLPIAFQV